MVGTYSYLVVALRCLCGRCPVCPCVLLPVQCAQSARCLRPCRCLLPHRFVYAVGDVVPRYVRRCCWMRAFGRCGLLCASPFLVGLTPPDSPQLRVAGPASRCALVSVRSAAVETQLNCPAGVRPCAAAGRARLLLIRLLLPGRPLRRRRSKSGVWSGAWPCRAGMCVVIGKVANGGPLPRRAAALHCSLPPHLLARLPLPRLASNVCMHTGFAVGAP